MTWLAWFPIAARALLAHRFRSSLTVLSITIGAFAIVFMSSLSESGLATLKQGIEDLGGARLILIAPKTPERARAKQAAYARGFSTADREILLSGVPHVVERSMFAGLERRDVQSDVGRSGRTDVVAADSRLFEAFRMPVGRGEAFSEDDNRRHAAVCVVGSVVAEALWETDPIGHMLSVGAARCRVVGVLAKNDRFGVDFGFDWNDLVVMPLETAAGEFAETREATLVIVKTDDPRSNDVVKRILNALLVERRHGVDDFSIADFATIMVRFERMFFLMKLIVGLLAGVALVIGGVGVMNMMLVSVSERVREIGIRKAVGATPAHIGRQFLAEALLLTFSGGAFGAATGALAAFGVALLLRSVMPVWVPAWSPTAFFTALLVSVTVGLVFGYFPARRAGRLDPMVAIRS